MAGRQSWPPTDAIPNVAAPGRGHVGRPCAWIAGTDARRGRESEGEATADRLAALAGGGPLMDDMARIDRDDLAIGAPGEALGVTPVSYTHLRAHETGRNLVCRLLLEKK